MQNMVGSHELRRWPHIDLAGSTIEEEECIKEALTGRAKALSPGAKQLRNAIQVYVVRLLSDLMLI